MDAETIKPEIQAAAKWWADQLRTTPRHWNGDGIQSALAMVVSAAGDRATDGQINTFQAELQRLLASDAGFSGDSWREDDPMWASGHRIVSTDYNPDPILSDALMEAGIKNEMLLPMKTIMWINPGSVKVSRGYGSRSEAIYGEQ